MPEPLPETLAWLRQTAKFEGAVTVQVLLHLLERVEALEAAENLRQQDEDAKLAAPTPEAAPVVTDKEVQKALRAYDLYLGRRHGAAQPPATPPAMQRLMEAPMDARGYVDLREPPPPPPTLAEAREAARQLAGPCAEVVHAYLAAQEQEAKP
jgi:hypothetical protein